MTSRASEYEIQGMARVPTDPNRAQPSRAIRTGPKAGDIGARSLDDRAPLFALEMGVVKVVGMART